MSQTTIEISQIMEMLAHRAPFLLVDRVVEYQRGKSIVAVKNVTYNEPFFTGHFPRAPTMPGVLIIEALAQSCGLLTSQETGIKAESGILFYLAGVDSARFKRIVVPGDQLMLHAEIDKVKRNLWRFNTKALVAGDLACEATLICVFKETVKRLESTPGAEA